MLITPTEQTAIIILILAFFVLQSAFLLVKAWRLKPPKFEITIKGGGGSGGSGKAGNTAGGGASGTCLGRSGIGFGGKLAGGDAGFVKIKVTR